jgi:hypothetical protein
MIAVVQRLFIPVAPVTCSPTSQAANFGWLFNIGQRAFRVAGHKSPACAIRDQVQLFQDDLADEGIGAAKLPL